MNVEQWLGEDNQLGIDIWHRKYQNNNETFEEWLDRVSGGNKDVRQLIIDKKFLFGGRILANRGLAKDGRKLSLSNCYVLSPPEDNIESIFDTAKKMARTYSYGGGVGIDIGKLSPRGAAINNAAKETSGSVSFMDLYSMVTGLIGQSGRRGALMISIPCNHPDLEEFIEIKNDLDKVTKANISIRITDDFMEAVKNREKYLLTFTREETGQEIKKEVNAYDIFKKLCYNNWNMAEPGMLFWDKIDNWNLLSEDPSFKYSGVNPCAEEPLPKSGACLLGSLNLAQFVIDGEFDFDEFRKAVKIAVTGLNEVLDDGIPLHPLKSQQESARDWRQIGLGIMSIADMLIKLGIRYGSDKSIKICDEIAHALADEALITSAMLAKQYGSYPNYNEKYILASPWLKTNASEKAINLIKKYGLRNSQLLTCAPTGCQKGSTIVGCGNNGLLRLDELVDNEGDQWQEINDIAVNQINGENKITKGYINGYAPTKVITLDSNLVLEATNNHKYRIIRDGAFDWVRSDELKVGDVIPSAIGYYNKTEEPDLISIEQTLYHNMGSIINLPTKMNENLAFILGAYYANGSNHYRGRKKKFASIRFSMNSNKKDDIANLCNKIFKVFGLMPTFSASKDRGTCTEVSLANVNLCEWLAANNLKKEGAVNLTMPRIIRESSANSIKAFLDGYYMCDGSSNGAGSKYIDTASFNMAQDLIIVMRAIGIYARARIDIKRAGAKSKKPMYRIYFGGYRSIDFPEEKMRYISNEVINNNNMVKEIAGEQFIYDTVKEINDSVCFTYDIEVENEHYYYANGVVSHNTLSTMLGVSGGIEPIFANYYTRKTESLKGHDEYYKVYTPIVKKYMDEHGLTDDSQLPDFFVTAQTLDYNDRIAMQSIWQKHIDASISSTINLPNSATVEDVENIYMKAWQKGLKGVTIFRDGCARVGILTTGDSKTEETKQSKDLPRGYILKADDNCVGKKRTLRTGCGTLHCEAFFDPDTGDLLETYFSKGSTGGCNNFMIGLSRMISLAARGGVDIYSIIDQLNSAGACPSYAVRSATKHDTSKGSCCPVAIGNALLDMYNEMQSEVNDDFEPKNKVNTVKPVVKKEITDAPKCPQCGEDLVFEGGCVACKSCGWSKCE